MIRIIQPTLPPMLVTQPAPTQVKTDLHQPSIPVSQVAAAAQAMTKVATSNSELVRVAKVVATDIAVIKGRVTSTEVLAELRRRGYDVDAPNVEKRFMGAVFRKGFTRVGYEPTGSHNRPVSIWTLKSGI